MLAVVASGCSPAEPTPGAPSEVRGLSMTPQLDPDSGAVILPADHFIPDLGQQDRIISAISVVVSQCAAEDGVTFVPAEPTEDPIYSSESYYGPWTLAQARKFAFVEPASDADLVANGILNEDGSPGEGPDGSEQGDSAPGPNAALTGADWAVIEECGTQAEGKEVLDDALLLYAPWVDALSDVEDAVLEDEEFQAAAQDVRTCLEARGLETQSGAPWIPQGVEPLQITEEQVALAVDVVECKEEADFTRRVAAVHAARQAVVIAEYADEMMAHRETLMTALDQADELLGSSSAS